LNSEKLIKWTRSVRIEVAAGLDYCLRLDCSWIPLLSESVCVLKQAGVDSTSGFAFRNFPCPPGKPHKAGSGGARVIARIRGSRLLKP